MPERLRLHEQFFHPLQGPNKARAHARAATRKPQVISWNQGFPLFNQWIGLRENLNRKPSIFPHEIWVFPGVSCDFSLKPIHWFRAYAEVRLGGNVDSLPACAPRLGLPSKCPDLIMAWLNLHVDNDLPNIPPPILGQFNHHVWPLISRTVEALVLTVQPLNSQFNQQFSLNARYFHRP